jgi:hypothetical protein
MGRGIDRYIDHPTHGILTPTPIPMVYQNLSYGIMNPSLLVEMRRVNFHEGGSKCNNKKSTPGLICDFFSLCHCTKNGCPDFLGYHFNHKNRLRNVLLRTLRVKFLLITDV